MATLFPTYGVTWQSKSNSIIIDQPKGANNFPAVELIEATPI